MTKMRGVFELIDQHMKVSGKGKGSIDGDEILDFVTGRRGHRPVSNGIAVGYAFAAFLEEDEIHSFMGMGKDSVAASMKKTPRLKNSSKGIGSGSTKRSTSSISNSTTRNRSTKRSSAGNTTVNLLRHMNHDMSRCKKIRD